MTKGEEVRGMIGVLRSIADIAEESSLTGSFAGGAKAGVRQYNAVVTRLQSLGVVPAEFLCSVGEDASLDEVGVASRCLAGYLKTVPQAAEGASGPEGAAKGPGSPVGA